MQGGGSCWAASAAAAWYLPQRREREAWGVGASRRWLNSWLLRRLCVGRSISQEKHVCCEKTPSRGRGRRSSRTLPRSHTHCRMASCGLSLSVFLNASSTAWAEPSERRRHLHFFCGFWTTSSRSSSSWQVLHLVPLRWLMVHKQVPAD